MLKSPVMITARLLPGVEVGGAFISIEYAGRQDRRGANEFRWYIDLGANEFTGDDLSDWEGLQGMLSSLLSFLGAFAEAQGYPDSENRDLFPEGLAEWAQQNSDEIGMLAVWLEETPDLIEE